MPTRDVNAQRIYSSFETYQLNVNASRRHNAMRRQGVLLISLVAAAAVFLMTRTAHSAPEDYSFHPIAESGDTFDPFSLDPPVINNSGMVVFRAARTNGKSSLFRGKGGALTTVATEGRFSRFGSPSINSSALVGFEASLRNVSGEGIFRSEDGSTVKIAGTRDAGDFDFVNARPSINDSGRVAFVGERIVGDDFIDGVYAGDGGLISAIYDSNGPFSDFSGNPSLNDYGQAAFLATLDSGVGGLFLGSGGEVTTVADDSGPFTSVFGFSDPSLNERGEVAFRAGTNTENPEDNSGSTGEGIFLFTDGNLAAVVESKSSDFASLGDPSLNNRGEVAFVVEPTSGESALVTGPDFVDDRVIGMGDRLFGRSISGLTFSR